MAAISRAGEGGFTYVATLAALAIFGIGLAALGQSWSALARRDKEDELLRVGGAYAQAIRSYYLRSPGARRQFPRQLEDLLEDKRFAGTERHLRRLYRDPVTRGQAWGLVLAADGGIMGVYSLSEAPALRRQPLRLRYGTVVAGQRYVDWKFTYTPES